MSASELPPRLSLGRDMHQHVVQFYQNDSSPFLDGLSRVVGSALGAGDSAIVIATPPHLKELLDRLKSSGLDLDSCIRSHRFVAADAAEVLSTFMVDGWPNAERFRMVVGGIIERSSRTSRLNSHVLAFGEMVALLWAEGKLEAAVHLERLWNELAQTHKFALYCAYPLTGFDHEDHGEILQRICAEHSQVLPAETYTTLTEDDDRLRAVLLLQQKALALETEVAERRKVQAALEQREAEQHVQVRELESLFDLTRALNTAVSLEQAYWDTLHSLMKAVRADRAAILGFDPDSRMHFKSWLGLSDEYRAAVDGHSPWQPDEPNPTVIPIRDVQECRELEAFGEVFQKEGIRSLAFIPIVYEKQLLGKFMLYFDAVHDFTADELRLAQAFAAHVAVAIRRHKSEAALRQSEKLAAAGRLAATVAHEINNPLEAVVNLLYLAKEDPAVPLHVRQYLADADSELNRISYLSRQTLGFYRENGSAVASRVGAHIAQILELLQSKTRNRNIAVKLEIDDDPRVIAVPGELKQVFANLLSNSIDAIGSNGSIVIRVSGRVREGIAGVYVRIWDSGPGIPRANLRNIFEPFFTTKRDVGTGLGLWICKSIVEKYSGKIRVRSNTVLGKSWTVVSIFLPSEVAIDSGERSSLHQHRVSA